MKNQIITVQGSGITVITKHEDDYLSITDIARHKNPEEPKDIVKNWMRSKTTIEFLGLSKTTLKTTGVSPWMKAFRIFNAWRHDIAPMVVTDMKITLFGFRNIVNQF